MALMRSTELRKRYTEDMERLKRQLPTAFVRATSCIIIMEHLYLNPHDRAAVASGVRQQRSSSSNRVD
jgi:hypothetical protein